jgi:hypothetical protein
MTRISSFIPAPALALALAFSFATLLGACASDSDITCDVVWSKDEVQLGTGTIVYDTIDDIDAALDACYEDQATHEQRPSDATKYACSCSN